MDTLLNILQITSYIITAISIPSAIGFIRHFVKYRKTISWKKVKKGAKVLIEKVKIINPDIIITFSGRGAIFANIIITELDNEYPVYTCLLKKRYNDAFLVPQNWQAFDTTKWRVYVPNEVLEFTNKKILIIDDITRYGETINGLSDYLKNNGISSQNIYNMSLMANRDVLTSIWTPQYYWRIIDTIEFKTPWEVD